MNFAVILDRTSATPLRHQIYQQWREGILNGRFRAGDRVPSTRELAAALEVSRSTVAEAWEQLIAEGYLDAAHGSGTFVCRQLPDQLLAGRPGPLREARAVRLSRYGAGLNRDFARPRPAPGVIDFTPGLPDRNSFPFTLWRRLLARHLRPAPPAVFDYAESSGGYGRLREQIAAYLGRMRAVRCSASQVIMVNGSQQALDLCARLLLNPGDAVVCENPGYQGARRVFEAQGARLIPAPIDAQGVAIGGVRKRARMIYVTPSHQFPTGVEMTLARRLELIEWARRRETAILEDDYSSEYRYSGPPLPSLQGLAGTAPVVYIGTFSKVMFPGLRIGYLVAPPDLAVRMERAKWLTDRHSAMLEQAALADFLAEGHLDRHIRRMRRLYGRRRAALAESLQRYFGDGVRMCGAGSGMHALVRFDDPGVARRAQESRVHLTSAEAYYLSGAPGGEFLMGFAALGESAIREGIKRLAR